MQELHLPVFSLKHRLYIDFSLIVASKRTSKKPDFMQKQQKSVFAHKSPPL
jgi:hypothetical protein